jgi:hypothetical protein
MTMLIKDASEIPEPMPILRTGCLAKFRLLDVACPCSSRLGQVLQKHVGRVLLVRPPHLEQDMPAYFASAGSG